MYYPSPDFDLSWECVCLQRPLALGADMCMYSATKYMNGKYYDGSYKEYYRLRRTERAMRALLSRGITYVTLYYFLFLGHSDVVMGLISVSRTDLYEKLKFLQNGEMMK